jgi:hypothetical protein
MQTTHYKIRISWLQTLAMWGMLAAGGRAVYGIAVLAGVL